MDSPKKHFNFGGGGTTGVDGFGDERDMGRYDDQLVFGNMFKVMSQPGQLSAGNVASVTIVIYAFASAGVFNVVQRMAVMAGGESIAISHVPEEIRSSESDDASDVGSLAGIGLDKLEKEAIRQTLAMTGGNRENTANLLGIGERTLYRKLKEYGIK